MRPTEMPDPSTPWQPMRPEELATALPGCKGRWWLSGSVALDLWLGQTSRPADLDISALPADLPHLMKALPPHIDAWAFPGDSHAIMSATDVPADAALDVVRLRDRSLSAWVAEIHLEDGTSQRWMYRRDPRLQLTWHEAVLDIGGVPTGAPQVQLLWKAFAPRPQDEDDKDRVWPHLDDDAKAWLERALLRVHPHSEWAIQVRSPFAPARASWTRDDRTRR